MARPDEDGKIECTGCNRRLPGDIEHFHRHRDAFKPKCKECRGSSFGVADINKVKDAQEGYKFCSKCHRELPATHEYFYTGGKSAEGLTAQCRSCKGRKNGSRERPNYGREDGKWKCKSCGEVYERTEENFYSAGDPEREGCPSDGLMSSCKECHTQRSNQLRREAENEVKNTLTTEEWAAIKEKFNHECAYCGTDSGRLERDHVIPISGGGNTSKENIVPACRQCNRSKSDKSALEWWPTQGHYDERRARKLAQHINGSGN